MSYIKMSTGSLAMKLRMIHDKKVRIKNITLLNYFPVDLRVGIALI